MSKTKPEQIELGFPCTLTELMAFVRDMAKDMREKKSVIGPIRPTIRVGEGAWWNPYITAALISILTDIAINANIDKASLPDIIITITALCPRMDIEQEGDVSRMDLVIFNIIEVDNKEMFAFKWNPAFDAEFSDKDCTIYIKRR